ncbi:hypothetical protein BK379_21430 [Escherichia coli]|nr:hypothetical protein BK379_21430 [Escherichia coli]
MQAGETPLQILDTQKGKAKKGNLWAYVSAAGSNRDIVVYDCWPGGRGFWLWTVTALCSVTARKMISGIREAVGRADDATAYSMVERSGTSSLAAGCAGETAVVASLTTG